MRPFKPEKFTGAGALFACLIVGALYSVHKGQDAAWDLKNYHLYNAWAFLHGRLTTDLAAVGLQGFFNPLLDVPYFWLGVGPLKNLPRVLSALQGLWFGGLGYVLLKIAARFANMRERVMGMVDIFAVAIGVSGTMVLSQAGSCTNELPVAFMVILGFYVLMPLAKVTPPERTNRRLLCAGLLFGIAAGLKPTAVVYTPAMGLALWIAMGAGAHGIRLSAIFLATAFAGFMFSYGWWGWRLFELTGNPVFPMFNQVFHSSLVPLVGGTDRQFMPRSVIQWFFYPFYWLHRNTYQGGNAFADPRYAAAMVATIFLLATSALRRYRQRDDAKISLFLNVFVVAAYIFWLFLYSILRYAVPIEVLTGFVIVLAVENLAEWVRAGSTRSKAFPWVIALVALLLIGFSRYPDWGHAPYSTVAFDVRPGPIEPKSMVIIIGQPNAYVIPFFDNALDSEFVGVSWLTAISKQRKLWAMTRDRLISHVGPMYTVSRITDTGDRAEFLALMPGVKFVNCRQIHSKIEQTARGTDLSDGLQLCEVLRI